MNGATDVNGKAPLQSNGNGVGRRADEPLIKVQPPRREDLQPSYAQVIKADTEDISQHGWYASMMNTLGTCIGTLGAIPCCIICPNPYKPVSRYPGYEESDKC